MREKESLMNRACVNQSAFSIGTEIITIKISTKRIMARIVTITIAMIIITKLPPTVAFATRPLHSSSPVVATCMQYRQFFIIINMLM